MAQKHQFREEQKRDTANIFLEILIMAERDLESLKQKCAVRNNPFFLSLSKGTSRIPDTYSAKITTNRNVLNPEKMNQSILHASDLSVKNSSVTLSLLIISFSAVQTLQRKGQQLPHKHLQIPN